MGWSSILKSLLTVFIFCTLSVISVESFKCIQESFNVVPWNTSTCETTGSCFSQIQKFETPSSDKNQQFKQKGCTTDDKLCKLEFSATLGNQQKFRYKNHCCTGEQCNNDTITLTPLSTEVNGVECSACYNEQNQTCPATTTLKCTGAENKCVEVTGTDSSSNLVVYGKGCATENACSLDIKVLDYIQIKTSCITAISKSATLKSVTALPIVLFLLKILL